jgi:hypothetical protein
MAEAGGIGDEMDARTRLLRIAGDEMDQIEAEFAGAPFRIGRVITVVEILNPTPDEDGDQTVGLRVRAGQYPWVALGMLDAAKKIVEMQLPRAE